MEKTIEKLLSYDLHTADETIKKCGKIYAILLKKYKDALKELNELNKKLEDTWIERYSYYKVDYEIQLTPQEVKMFVEYDKDTNEIRKMIRDKEADIKIIEGHLKNIEGVRWDIKTLLEYKKIEKILI